MENIQRRHDISDQMWVLLAPHLPGQRGQWGGDSQRQSFIYQCSFPVTTIPGHKNTLICHIWYCMYIVNHVYYRQTSKKGGLI